MTKATLDERTHYSSAERFIERPVVRDTIMTLIVINAIVLGVLTYSEVLPRWLVTILNVIDMAVTFIFVAEILLKLYVYRLKFFKLGWNWFDFIVVGVSMIPGGSAFNVLRALRVLRLLRLLHFIPTMKRITEALLTALPGMGAILAILGLVFYVSVVMATYLFSGSQNTENFASLGASALTMFEVLTMEGWNGHMRDLLGEYPWAWMFFIPFILFTVWAILNLFTAVIVDSLQDSALEKMLDAEEKISDELEVQESHDVIRHRELMALIGELRAEVQELKASRRSEG